MFNKVIHIHKENDIRFGTTKCGFHQTMSEIQKLLEKHGCQQIRTTKDGNEWLIEFVYQGKPYLIQIPQVFIKGIYAERIGVRIVLYYLETVLELSKARVIKFDFAMLGTQMINIEGVNKSFAEVMEKQLPIPKLLPGGEQK